MSHIPIGDRQAVVAKLREIRIAWISAVECDDIDRLVALVTEDITVVYGNGKSVFGKDALKANLEHDLGLFDVEPRDSSDQFILYEKWAVDFLEVDRKISAVKGGPSIEIHTRLVVIYSKQPDGAWKIARVVELAD